jgi:FixJ family two-component response regulator
MPTIQPQLRSRPVAYIAVHDTDVRAQLVEILEQAGWAVIPQPTGFHLLQAIVDVIDGTQRWLDPTLIVIDAYARGCAGTTIAAGLRDLGIEIPIVLLREEGQPVPISDDEALRIVDTRRAVSVVTELASRRQHGARDRPRPHADSGRSCTGTYL